MNLLRMKLYPEQYMKTNEIDSYNKLPIDDDVDCINRFILVDDSISLFDFDSEGMSIKGFYFIVIPARK